MSASNRTWIGPDSDQTGLGSDRTRIRHDSDQTGLGSDRTRIRPDSGLEPILDLIENLGVTLVRPKGDGKALEEIFVFLRELLYSVKRGELDPRGLIICWIT